MDAEETAFFAELDAILQRIIDAHPGLRPNELASIALVQIDPSGDAPDAVAFAARRTIRDRAADLLGVEREPQVMNADEARLAAALEFAVERTIRRSAPPPPLHGPAI